MLWPLILRSLATGLGLGIGAAAPIGPVNVEIARRTLRDGWRAGFLVGCGAVSVDCFYLFVSTLSLSHLLQRRWIDITLGLAGGALLAYLGFMSIRAAHREFQVAHNAGPKKLSGNKPGPHGNSSSSPGVHYLAGVLMTLFNPMTLAFWFLSVPAAAAGAGRSLAWVCAGVFFAAFAWVCFISTLVFHAGRNHRGRWIAAADLLGGTTLLYYAARAIWRVAFMLL